MKEIAIKPELSSPVMIKRARAASAELSVSKRSGVVTRKLAMVLIASIEDDGAG
jgi:hypothetical protein